MQSVTIGRDKTNNIIFDYKQVSSKHVKITPVGANSVIIEDLNSTNGTYVNGVRIKRKIISKDDRVKIANVLLNTKRFFKQEPLNKKFTNNSSEINDEEKIKDQFKKLKGVWEDYNKIKINHKKKGFWKNIALSTVGMGIGVALMPFTGHFGYMIGGLLGRGATGFLKNDEKMQIVINEFKVNYVCPKCKTFLGETPYENLVNRKVCFRCKAKWI